MADTNLLVSSIFWNGAPYVILQHALQGKIEIIVSQQILNEMRKVLTDPKARFNLEEQEVDDIIHCITLSAKLVEPTTTVNTCRDPNDNHIIACALSAKATCIVTRDEDLLILKTYQGIKITTPEEFLTLIREFE